MTSQIATQVVMPITMELGKSKNIFRHFQYPYFLHVESKETIKRLIQDLKMGEEFVPDIIYLRSKYLNPHSDPIDVNIKRRIVDNPLLRSVNNMTDGAALSFMELAKQYRGNFTNIESKSDVFVHDRREDMMAEICGRANHYCVHAIGCLPFINSPFLFQIFMAEGMQYLMSKCSMANKIPDLVLFCSMVLDLLMYTTEQDHEDWYINPFVGIRKEFYEENKDVTQYYKIDETRKYVSITSEIPEWRVSERETHMREFPDDVLTSIRELHETLSDLPDCYTI